MSYLPFVVVIVVLGVWYFNYFRSVKAAGGRGGLMQKQHQEEFGLSDGETITSWWSAVCYIGPLTPGGGVPHLGEKLLHALATSNERGAQVHVWTVDEPADVELCLGLGVDAIITNRPAAARLALA